MKSHFGVLILDGVMEMKIKFVLAHFLLVLDILSCVGKAEIIALRSMFLFVNTFSPHPIISFRRFKEDGT